MARRVRQGEPVQKKRTHWPVTTRYAEELDRVPRNGDWYEIATFKSAHYGYEVAASLRGRPMRARQAFPVAEGTRRGDWEFIGTRRRAKMKGGAPGKVLGSAVWARWVGEL